MMGIVSFQRGAPAMTVAGLTTIASAHGPEDTVSRFEAALQDKGMTLFARIDHAAGAVEAGLELRPTLLLIFGNPKAGTNLMQADQTVGIDLPLKALIWQDAAGKTWLSYNEPRELAQRHGLGDQLRAPVDAMTAGLVALARQATAAA
jgi:uncharacterized protein (DUF302 family)